MNENLSHFLHSSQSHSTLRNWQSKGTIKHSSFDFVYPIFVLNDDDKQDQSITSMPGISRMGVNVAYQHIKDLVENCDLKSVLIFPVIDNKQIGSAFEWDQNPALRLIEKLRNDFPQLIIISDVCLCTFSPDGHCCVFDETGKMDNEKSIELLAKIALKYAQTGAHVIAPSDMMDGRIAAIKKLLQENRFHDVAILSYSAKFNSCFYGPFRDAAGSAPKFGDRKCYQLPPGSKGLAMRAVERDIKEGADMVMVKPGLPYLDVICDISNRFPNYPIAVYHVSGEYSMLLFGSKHGIFDLKNSLMEIITSFKRSGANIIITYFTPMILKWIKEDENKS